MPANCATSCRRRPGSVGGRRCGEAGVGREQALSPGAQEREAARRQRLHRPRRLAGRAPRGFGGASPAYGQRGRPCRTARRYRREVDRGRGGMGRHRVQEGDGTGKPSETTLEALRKVYETNVFGVVAVTNAVLPLLRKAKAARIVNVSSEVGSIAAMTDPRAANPGYCATDLNGHSGFRTLPDDGPTGQLWATCGPPRARRIRRPCAACCPGSPFTSPGRPVGRRGRGSPSGSRRAVLRPPLPGCPSTGQRI
jgi:short chain dehydrogenase